MPTRVPGVSALESTDTPTTVSAFELVLGDTALPRSTGNISPEGGVLLPLVTSTSNTNAEAGTTRTLPLANSAGVTNTTTLSELSRLQVRPEQARRHLVVEKLERLPATPAGERSLVLPVAAEPLASGLASRLTQGSDLPRLELPAVPVPARSTAEVPRARIPVALPSVVASVETAATPSVLTESATGPARSNSSPPLDTIFSAATQFASDNGSQPAAIRQEAPPPSVLPLSSAPSPSTGSTPPPVVTLTEAAMTAPDAMADDIADRLVRLVERSGNAMRVQLNPPDLGSIEIRVQLNDDRASVWFQAAQPAAREALEQALPRLRSLLESAGMQLGDAGVAGDGRNGGRPAAADEFQFVDQKQWTLPTEQGQAPNETSVTDGIDLYV